MPAESEQAALKVLYLVVRDKHNNGRNVITGRLNGWTKALNAFALIFSDRINNN